MKISPTIQPIRLTTVLARTFDIAEGCPSDPKLFNLCIILDAKRNIELLISAFPSFGFVLSDFQEIVDLELAVPIDLPPPTPHCPDTSKFSIDCVQKLRQFMTDLCSKHCNMMTRFTLEREIAKAVTYGDFKKLQLHVVRFDTSKVALYETILQECCRLTLEKRDIVHIN